MARLIYSMMVTLDGFVATADGGLDWVIIDEELHSFANDQAREAGAFLYGRRMYEVMQYWQTADADASIPAYMAEFARIWKRTPKVVFSRTLESVGENARLVRDGAVEEVERLKQDTDGQLTIGGPDLASTFVARGLIDEFRPIVHPVAIGSGKPFLRPFGEQIDLKLLETKSFGSGATYLAYERVNKG
jgi:dihydrofolate reductase